MKALSALEAKQSPTSVFADDIDGLAGEEEELANLVERLEKASTAHGMEIGAEKTKLMTNNTSGINTEIKVNGQRLMKVTSFKYLGSVITNEGSKLEILSRVAQTTAALARLNPVWNDRSISLRSKIRLMRSLVTSIFLYACESRTLTAELQRRIQAMEIRCYRKILRISRKDQRGSPCQGPAGNRITRRPPGQRKETQTAVVWSRLPFIRSGQHHLPRHSESGKKTRQTEEEVGRQHHGMDRPGVLQFPDGSAEQGKIVETGCEIIYGPQRPSRLRDR